MDLLKNTYIGNNLLPRKNIYGLLMDLLENTEHSFSIFLD